MNTSKRQSYTSSPKTSSSRCIRHSHSAGFTLIELLVVVSIIALLSTIVFAALSDARTKARNTAKNNLVMEYIKALELYKTDTGSYPSHPETPLVPKCIGFTQSETCYAGIYFGSSTINNAFALYMSGDFSHKGSVIGTGDANGANLNGIQYACKDTACNEYLLMWFLEKQVSNCVAGARITRDVWGNTYCSYPQ